MIYVRNKKYYKGEGYYIGRPSSLGNPFSHLNNSKAEFKVSNRDEAVEKYKEWILKELTYNDLIMQSFAFLCKEYKRTGELNLICFCEPLSCHGHILKELIESIVDKGMKIDASY